MKRLFSLLLCLCMMLPLLALMPIEIGAVTSTAKLSVEKTTFAYGEPIMVTPLVGGKSTWIGIAPKGKVSSGSMRWMNIETTDGSGAAKGAGVGVAVDIRQGQVAGGRYAQADIAPGEWTIFWCGSGAASGYDKASAIDIVVEAGPISTDKVVYKVGDPILVTAARASESSKTWYGIVPDKGGKPLYTYGTMIYYNLYQQLKEGEASNTQDIRAHSAAGFGTMGNADLRARCADYLGCTERTMFCLPAGTYWLVYCADSSTVDGGKAVTHKIQIKIESVLSTDKKVYAYGEPIMVTPTGEGADWFFIAPKHDDPAKHNYSIRWAYVSSDKGSAANKGAGSGVAVDIRKATHSSNYPALGDIPPGEYSLFMVFDPNSGAAAADHGTRVDITVGSVPDAPEGVTYDLDDKTTGLANGRVTVTVDPEKFAGSNSMPTHAILYWGNADGPLADYTEIGYRALTAATTEITMIPGSVIPSEATYLWVSTYNDMGASPTMLSVALPADRTYPAPGEEKLSFQIVSDVHSTTNASGLSRIENFFNDVKLLDPDSAGIFVSGDITNLGNVAEYENLYALWDRVLGTQSDVMIPFFPAVGNHEFKPDNTLDGYGDYATKQARFITYLNQYLAAAGKDQITNGNHYYDLWIGGYHFIFLASEVAGTNAYISDAQLKWLDETLAQDRKNGHPSFIMLHQCLYNTVSGGMPAHGWNGVVAGDANWEAWKAAIGANNAATNRTMKDTYEAPLRNILRKYPEAMMFSGHSHWAMSDINNMYNPNYPTDPGNALPNYLFNTGAVDYLASALTGASVSGSQGYYVYIFEDYIEFRGRDFANKKWIPNATYRIALDEFCVHENAADCAEQCPDCGEALVPAVPHESDYACNATCKHCGQEVVPTSADHTYANACDTDCNLCGATREVGAHVGEFACSTECAICGAAIEGADHTYANACDTDCNLCGATREVGAHVGEFACSEHCKHCGAAIEGEEHIYTNACDADCNLCGATREVGAHIGEYACSEHCKHCGAAIESEEHIYTNACDTTCFRCGSAVEPQSAHTGEYACSTDCKFCGINLPEVSDHAWNDGAVTKEPDVGEKGEKTYTCTTCGATKTEELDALPATPDTGDSGNADSDQSGSGESNSSNAAGNGSNANAAAGEGLPIGAVIGIAVGAVVLLGIGGICLYRFVLRKKK